MFMNKRGIAILGSTGSIGTQTLEVMDQFPELFQVEVLTANSQVDLLVQQAKKYQPNAVVIANESKYKELSEALASEPIKVFAGAQALEDIVSSEGIDLVLTALVGYSGLLPTIAAIKARKTIALANKETLVVAGELITKMCQEYGVKMIPVDSEHSAIYQCLVGEDPNTVDKLILTASGGPFRGRTVEELAKVSIKDALNHPNWDMGAKITIDSASLMNKGLEVIEAKWLFGVELENIDVVVHRQSIIHSMVQFNDGSIKAQLGLPDMKLPIQYALGYPDRLQNDFKRFSFLDYPSFTFEQPDLKTFRNLQLAYDASNAGGNMPCVLNAANEVAVDAFLKEKIGFLQMSNVIEETLNKVEFVDKPSLEDYIQTDKLSRQIAQEVYKLVLFRPPNFS